MSGMQKVDPSLSNISETKIGPLLFFPTIHFTTVPQLENLFARSSSKRVHFEASEIVLFGMVNLEQSTFEIAIFKLVMFLMGPIGYVSNKTKELFGECVKGIRAFRLRVRIGSYIFCHYYGWDLILPQSICEYIFPFFKNSTLYLRQPGVIFIPFTLKQNDIGRPFFESMLKWVHIQLKLKLLPTFTVELTHWTKQVTQLALAFFCLF